MWEIVAAITLPEYLAMLVATPLVLMFVRIIILGKPEPPK